MIAMQSSGFWFTLYPLLVPICLVIGYVVGRWHRGRPRRRYVA